jgi:transposase InsO family protein
MMQRFGCSQRNALRVVQMSASTFLYKPIKKDESVLKLRIKQITQVRVHYGYRRVHVMLRREGHMDNVKRVYRLYREEGLSLRLKRPRRNKAAKLRQPKQLASAINEIWTMDFVADAQAKIGAWRTYYNETRPHSALEWATRAEFARRCCLQAATAIPEEPEVPTSEQY